MVVALFVHPDAYLARYGEPDKASSGLGGTSRRGRRAGGERGASAGEGEGEGEGEGAWTVPYWFVDGGFAAMVLLLAAHDAGLGACFLGNFRGEPDLRTALGVPDDRRYIGAVLMGEPGDIDPPSPSLARGRRRSPTSCTAGGGERGGLRLHPWPE